MKKIFVLLFIFLSVVGFMFAEGNKKSKWDKIGIFGTPFYFSAQKILSQDESDADVNMMLWGSGFMHNYIMSPAESKFGITLNMAGCVTGGNNLAVSKSGYAFDFFAGFGGLPIKTENVSFVITGGVGVETFNAHTGRHQSFSFASMNLGVNSCASFMFSDNVGLGVSFLCTTPIFSGQTLDVNGETKSDVKFFSGFNIMPSIGVAVKY